MMRILGPIMTFVDRPWKVSDPYAIRTLRSYLIAE